VRLDFYKNYLLEETVSTARNCYLKIENHGHFSNAARDFLYGELKTGIYEFKAIRRFLPCEWIYTPKLV
jgi:hypothetical protein